MSSGQRLGEKPPHSPHVGASPEAITETAETEDKEEDIIEELLLIANLQDDSFTPQKKIQTQI